MLDMPGGILHTFDITISLFPSRRCVLLAEGSGVHSGWRWHWGPGSINDNELEKLDSTFTYWLQMAE